MLDLIKQKVQKVFFPQKDQKEVLPITGYFPLLSKLLSNDGKI